MGAFGGLRARAGRSVGCTVGFALPFEPIEPMRSSSALKVSDASKFAPSPSMERVLRCVLPAWRIDMGWRIGLPEQGPAFIWSAFVWSARCRAAHQVVQLMIYCIVTRQYSHLPSIM